MVDSYFVVATIGDSDDNLDYIFGSDWIEWTQNSLATLGYDVIWGGDPPDGIFGEGTYRALRAFQFDYIDANSEGTPTSDNITQFYDGDDFWGMTPNGTLNVATVWSFVRALANNSPQYNWTQPEIIDIDNDNITINDPPRMEKSAAYDFALLKSAVESEGGVLTCSSVFRTHQRQVFLKALQIGFGGANASSPGTSAHGFACAMDIKRFKLALIATDSADNRIVTTGYVSGTSPKIMDEDGEDNLDRFRELALCHHFYPLSHESNNYNCDSYGYGSEAWHFDHTPVHLPMTYNGSNAISTKTLKLRKSKVLDGTIVQPDEDTGCAESSDLVTRIDVMEYPFFAYRFTDSGNNEYEFKVQFYISNARADLNDILSPCNCDTFWPFTVPTNAFHSSSTFTTALAQQVKTHGNSLGW